MTDPAAPPSTANHSFAERMRDGDRWYASGGAAWGRYSLQLLAVAAVGLLVYAAAAAAVNPRGEFPWQPLAPISSEDPAYKAWLLDHRPAPPQVLVLGSSRSQKVAPADVEAASGLTAFNFAIADAYPEDALRVYDGVHAQVHPKEVLLGLDLNRLEPRQEASNRTRYAFGPLHGDAAPGDWAAAFGHTYTDLYAREAGGAILENLGLVGAGLVDFDPDGLAHYVPWETAIAHGTFDQNETLAKFIGDRHGYPPYDGLDPIHTGAVRDLVDHARADNVTIRIWLTPAQPAVEARYGNESYPLYRAAARDLLVSLCQPGVHAYDYGVLATFGGRPEWFFDGSHMMQENTRLAVQGMYAGIGDLCAG